MTVVIASTTDDRYVSLLGDGSTDGGPKSTTPYKRLAWTYDTRAQAITAAFDSGILDEAKWGIVEATWLASEAEFYIDDVDKFDIENSDTAPRETTGDIELCPRMECSDSGDFTADGSTICFPSGSLVAILQLGDDDGSGRVFVSSTFDGRRYYGWIDEDRIAPVEVAPVLAADSTELREAAEAAASAIELFEFGGTGGLKYASAIRAALADSSTD